MYPPRCGAAAVRGYRLRGIGMGQLSHRIGHLCLLCLSGAFERGVEAGCCGDRIRVKRVRPDRGIGQNTRAGVLLQSGQSCVQIILPQERRGPFGLVRGLGEGRHIDLVGTQICCECRKLRQKCLCDAGDLVWAKHVHHLNQGFGEVCGVQLDQLPGCDFGNDAVQGIQADRFGVETVHAGRDCAFAKFLAAMRRQADNMGVFVGAIAAAQVLCGVDPVHNRHADVHKNDVKGLGA
mmetsp:Transcript_397/g.1147  ORF Transcript_397/g.1147 Transcript_397/m.1147 type:complete len:236 (+) Transcript_397:650-1357(+)